MCLPRRVMLVGWGGNNGSTLTASILANKKCVLRFVGQTLKVRQEYSSNIRACSKACSLAVASRAVDTVRGQQLYTCRSPA